jgi:dihydrofolate reductase
MMTSVFVGISLDGFLARRNGEYDFLPADGGDCNGYAEFMATVDALVIGRKTFETVLTFSEWPYGDRQVVVLSRRPLDFPKVRGRIEQIPGPPPEIIAQLCGRGFKHAYIDGGIAVQTFLRAGQIQRLIINRYPVLIGDGIPLFGHLPQDVRLRHIATETRASGLVKSEYEVLV